MASNGSAHKCDGSFIGEISFPLGMTRAVFHDALHTYVEKLGIKIKFDTKVVDYFETTDQAGVVLEDGLTATGDIVVAADGIGTKSWKLVSGTKETPVGSGFALFRATFPAELALCKPRVAAEYGDVDDKVKLFIGDGAHVIIGRAKSSMLFMLTHRVRGQLARVLPRVLSYAYFQSTSL